MLKKRLIASLILRDGQVIQTLRFKHTNVIHVNASFAVEFFNRWAVDEIVILDVSRNLDHRQKFYDAIVELSTKCFVPLTAGGWVTDLNEARHLLRCGGDKIIVNTRAVRHPEFITECANALGTQCVVVSVDVKKNEADTYEVYIDRGREATGLDPVSWVKQAETRGAGEIYLTSIDHDGARKGYDLDLVRSVVDAVDIPVIAFGGVSKWEHLVDGIVIGKADAVAAANVFHYTEHSTKKAKEFMKKAGVDTR